MRAGEGGLGKQCLSVNSRPSNGQDFFRLRGYKTKFVGGKNPGRRELQGL